MSRNFSEKTRGKSNKREKPVLLLVVEGKNNKTESLYFNAIKRYSSYSINIHSTGETDPENMLRELERLCDEKSISKEKGDEAFVVLDLDVDDKKASTIPQLMNEHPNSFIISNPCFEIWYINHFYYTTKFFSSNKDVKKCLGKEIKGYKENMDVFPLLIGNIDKAIRNSNKQILFGNDNSWQWPSADFNPRTDVVKLIKLLELEKKQFSDI